MPGITGVFLRWTASRSFLSRGYWLVASLYLVLDADLNAFELVFLGTAQGIVALFVEVPAGVVADTISRKWALVIAHLLIGGSMAATGMVTAFPALVVTQIIWGVGWTFASGADVAWVTDELNEPTRIAGVLTAGARWEQIGAAAGLLGIGLLALGIGRGEAMVAAGLAMVLLGIYVVVRFQEHGFTPTTTRRWQQSLHILRRGAGLARHDREILLVLAATVLVNGAAEGFGRLYPKQLIDLGFPARFDPIVWYTLLGFGAFVLGALALRIIEGHIAGVGVARRVYALACFVAMLGLLVLAAAPSFLIGSVGVLLVSGVALTVSRAVGVIWVNRRSSSDVRATMQSMLAQAEYGGEIIFGVTLGGLAQLTTLPLAFAGAAAIFLLTGLLVIRSRTDGR